MILLWSDSKALKMRAPEKRGSGDIKEQNYYLEAFSRKWCDREDKNDSSISKRFHVTWTILYNSLHKCSDYVARRSNYMTTAVRITGTH